MFFFNFKESWLDYKYIYLKNDRYCKYRDFTIIPDCARWRMIFVRETDDNEDLLSRVIFCTKQWPDRFLYLDNTYFKRAKGLPTVREAITKCLFMVRLVLLCKTKTVVNNENPLLYAKYIIYFQKSSLISYMNVKSYWPLKIQVKRSL